MKRSIIYFLLTLATILPSMAQEPMETEAAAADMTTDQYKRFIRAIGLVDEGLYEAALYDFDFLRKENPGNYFIDYEYLYTLYQLERYKEVAKESKKLLNNKKAQPQVFQICGNAYDIIGKPKEALKIYEEGLKRFPDSGYLCLEIGNLSFNAKDYTEAVKWYDKGITVQPEFASNYYRAAQIYGNTDEYKVWGIIYAEAATMLAVERNDRHKEMADMIADLYRSSITQNGDTLKVKLCPSKKLNVDPESNVTYLGFLGVFEVCTLASAISLESPKKGFDTTLANLTELRKGIVESYFADTDNLYGDAMYLMPYWKKVIDSGHWEAYNAYLFMYTFPEEFDAWAEANQDKMDAFVKWFNKDPFSLDKTHTIGINTIYRDYRPIDLMQAMSISAGFARLTDPDKAENGENSGSTDIETNIENSDK